MDPTGLLGKRRQGVKFTGSRVEFSKDLCNNIQLCVSTVHEKIKISQQIPFKTYLEFRQREPVSRSGRGYLGSCCTAPSYASDCKRRINMLSRIVCHIFGHPALTSSFQVYVLCRCCRHATKIINHHSKAETISKLTVHLQLLQNHFSPAMFLVISYQGRLS